MQRITQDRLDCKSAFLPFTFSPGGSNDFIAVNKAGGHVLRIDLQFGNTVNGS